MLYDGMGSNILKRNLSSNSFLNKNKLMNIDAVFPATTTASTTSVLSGKNPNEHGWLGWDLYFKEFDKTISIFPNTIKDTNLLFSEQNVSEIKYQYTNIIKKVATKVNSVGLFPFKETKYTIACVEPENYNFYKKYDFEFEKWEDKPYYFFVMIRKNF